HVHDPVGRAVRLDVDPGTGPGAVGIREPAAADRNVRTGDDAQPLPSVVVERRIDHRHVVAVAALPGADVKTVSSRIVAGDPADEDAARSLDVQAVAVFAVRVLGLGHPKDALAGNAGDADVRDADDA